MQGTDEQQSIEKQKNAEKAEQAAKGLYPHEKWEFLEDGIYIAKSRMPHSAEQINVLDKELQQARILVERGSTVYLLPETDQPKIKNKKYPDAVVDDLIMEFKTVSGNKRKIKENYKEGREKADNVFLYIEPPFSHRTVVDKLYGTIKGKGYNSGLIWVYFSHIEKLSYWSVKDLI